jgi:hypothetical protein
VSKASKASAKKSVAKEKLMRQPRAAALAVDEPRLSVSRRPRKAKAKPRARLATGTTAPAAVQNDAPGQILQLMLTWSPWSIMLRQQALLASMLSTMMRPERPKAAQRPEASARKKV